MVLSVLSKVQRTMSIRCGTAGGPSISRCVLIAKSIDGVYSRARDCQIWLEIVRARCLHARTRVRVVSYLIASRAAPTEFFPGSEKAISSSPSVFSIP